MAKDISVDHLAKVIFWITLGGCVAYVAAVAVFVLGSEPKHTPDTSVEHSR
ncbi:MAG: hypothetical protein L6Q84_03775 [Polyangiaceae bacterium]|nr:hypothetical protein [Polyangiaceae bacterium]